MNRTSLLGGLFARASSISGGATLGDLLDEIRKYSKKKKRPTHPEKSSDRKADSSRENDKNLKAA